MDIDESDLQQLFEMIDVHGEGEIEAAHPTQAILKVVGPLWVATSCCQQFLLAYGIVGLDFAVPRGFMYETAL